jgi:hypothetical protein
MMDEHEEKRIENIRRNLEGKSSEELFEIWQKNDRNEWTAEAFVAIEQILESRGETPGQQPEPYAPPPANRLPRPGCVTAFAILLGVAAVFYSLGSLLGLLGSFGDTGRLIEIGTTLVLSGLYIAVAIGLWSMKNWARIAVIVLQGLGTLILFGLLFSGMLYAVIGIIVGVYIIYWFVVNGKYFKSVSAG